MIAGNPSIRAFPQYAFLDAILNNSNTNIDKLCSIYIEDIIHFNWNYQELKADVNIIDGGIDVYRRGNGAKQVGGFYCECEEFEELIFRLQYMQYTNIWDRIAFFYDTEDAELFLDDNFCSYEFSMHCCGDWRIDVHGENTYYKINRYEDTLPQWYKLQKNIDTIHLYSSYDGQKWSVINTAQLESGGKKARVGFYIHLYENQYHKWICNNFIQIGFGKDNGKPIDYVGFINRDWKNYAINPLIKFSYDKQQVIKRRCLWNYIVDNICSGRYLEIWLDEYYLQGLPAFQEYHNNHESLIYGFDEEEKRISLMSFKGGKPILINVTSEVIDKAWESAYENNQEIHTFEFSPDGNGYTVDVEHICRLLQDYLTGENSSSNYRYIAQEDRGIFGIKIYEEILNSADNRELFLEDRRIPFIIKEHKECMLFRIKFLYEYGTIREQTYLCLMEYMKNIVKYANVVLNLCIKNSLKSEERTQGSIWKYLKKLSVLEEECYQILVSELHIFITR